MYVVIEKNAFDKNVIVLGWHGSKPNAQAQADAENIMIKNDSESVHIVTGSEFQARYSKRAIA